MPGACDFYLRQRILQQGGRVKALSVTHLRWGRLSQDHKANIFSGLWPGLAFDSTTTSRTSNPESVWDSHPPLHDLRMLDRVISYRPGWNNTFCYSFYISFVFPGHACWDSPFFHWLEGLITAGNGCWNSGSLLLSFGWSSGFAFFFWP